MDSQLQSIAVVCRGRIFSGSWQTADGKVHVDSPYGSLWSEPIGRSDAQLLAETMFLQIVRGFGQAPQTD